MSRKRERGEREVNNFIQQGEYSQMYGGRVMRLRLAVTALLFGGQGHLIKVNK